jgi:hypothetical protein
MNRTALLCTLVTASLFSVPSFAADTSHLDVGGNTAFYCKYTTGAGPLGATVDIDTDGVLVQGFCDGSWVPSKGHVRGLPVTELQDTYFLAKLDSDKKHGSIAVRLNGFGSIVCENGQGDMTKLFRPDGQFC